MSPTIIVALALAAVGFLAAVFLAIKNQVATVYRGAKVLLDVDDRTGNLVCIALNKKKRVEAYGSGAMAYPTGLFVQPYILRAGWKTAHFANTELIIGRTFFTYTNTDFIQENESLRAAVLDLQNENARLRAETRQLRRPVFENMIEASKVAEKMKLGVGNTIIPKEGHRSGSLPAFPTGGGGR